MIARLRIGRSIVQPDSTVRDIELVLQYIKKKKNVRLIIFFI